MDQLASTETSKTWPQYLACITAVLLAVGCGLHYGWTSPAIPKLLEKDLQFDVSKNEISYIVMIHPLGFAIGCPFSAILLDNIGRKSTILVLVVPQILAWLLIANSMGVPMLYAARLASGVGDGAALTAVPVYICEVSEPRIRGAVGTSYAIAVMIGSLLINCYGSYTPLRTSAYISLLLPLLFLVSFVGMPESPYFLLIKGHTEDARKSLKRLRRMNNVEEELMKLTSDIERQTSESKRIRDVFMIKSNLKPFLIIIGLRTLQQFAGGAAINFYNQVIFQQADGNISYKESSIIYYFVLVSSCFCCTLIVDKFGRKPLLMWSSTGSAIFLLVEGLYFRYQYYGHDLSSYRWVPVTALVLYTIARAVGLVPIPTLLSGELFSASIKTKALGMINIYFAICLSTSAKLFQWLTDSFGMHTPFFVYVGFCTVGVFFIYYCIPETKNKTLEEIQQRFKGND